MKKHVTFRYEFVESFPETLEQNVLYLSMPYATATHRCACGCGNEVVTPFSPTDWQLNFDGVSISLTPSIGNWNFPCKSHYFIRNNNVQWARQWSQREINAGRAQDQRTKEAYNRIAEPPTALATPTEHVSFLRRFKNRFF
jgi:hypothetical protein